MAGPKTQPSTTGPARLSPWVLPLTAVFVLVVGFLFVKPYIAAILFSALISFVFNPVYKRFVQKTKRAGLSVALTICVATLSIIIPCFLLAMLTVGQVNTMISNYQHEEISFGSANIQEVVDTGIDRAENIVHVLPGGESITINKDAIVEKLKDGLLEGLRFLAESLAHVGAAFFGLIGTFILSIFLISSMLRYQDELLAFLRRISPFDNSINNLFLHRVGLMTKAMVKGQFVIATCQGFAATFSLWLVGLDYFGFFFVFLTFMSFIPLGAGIITIPIGFVFIFTGHFWQGAFIILWHMLVVSMIDNILRPRLVHPDARLNTALMLLAVFSGMAIFGFLGVVYGPVVMILLVTTIRIYAEYNGKRERLGLVAESEFSGKSAVVAVPQKHHYFKKLFKR